MTPLPPGFRIALDRTARWQAGGRTLTGGSPKRALRLTEAGSAAVRAMCRGDDPSNAARTLARRLVDAGLAHPVPPTAAAAPDLTVVIPVRDRVPELARCLTALSGEARVLVVDDGSVEGARIAAVSAEHGATLISRAASGGPAAARNTALAHVDSELIAFLDSDCEPGPGWLKRLAAHFDDPLVGAVAPRVRPRPFAEQGGWMDRVAVEHSPLDMGPDPQRVIPGGPVAYLPSAALLTRRNALGSGFAEALRYGEDVDLIWRMHDAGWHIRYDPAVTVHHIEPIGARALLARRFRYGTSAAELARIHPDRLAPAVLAPRPTLAAALLLAGHPVAAVTLTGLTGAIMARRSHRAGIPLAQALRWSTQATASAVLALGRAASSLAAPVLVAGLAHRRWRSASALLLAAAPLADWARRRPAIDPLRWTCGTLLGDAAYGAGVWWSCWRARTVRPLVPRLL